MSLALKGILLGALFLATGRVSAQNTEVRITGIRSGTGIIQLQIYTNDKAFQAEVPLTTLYFTKEKIKNQELLLQFYLAPGTYGLALLDDENEDKKMNYNWIGWPKEGFGFSNFYLNAMSKPHFEEFDFTLQKGQKQTIVMKIKYM